MARRAAAATSPDAAMTLEQWADMDEDEPGELVDGRLEEEEVPTFLHEAVVSWLLWALKAWLTPIGGWVLGSEHKLGVARRRGRKPDLTVYLPGDELPSRRASLGRRPPSAVVEVISPRPRDGRRDRVDKLRDYAAFGVRHYWLVDPQLRTMEVLELRPRRKPIVVVSASSGTLTVPGCPGLRLDLDALWAEMDRLPDDETPRPPSSRPRARRTRSGKRRQR
jgi:Uma2 family endonuclease